MRDLNSKPIKIAKAFFNDRPNCSYLKSLLLLCSRHLSYTNHNKCALSMNTNQRDKQKLTSYDTSPQL